MRQRSRAASRSPARSCCSRLMATKRSAAGGPYGDSSGWTCDGPVSIVPSSHGRVQMRVAADEARVVGVAAPELAAPRTRCPSCSPASRVARVEAQAAPAHLADGDVGRDRGHVDEHVDRRAVPALAEQPARPEQHEDLARGEQPRGPRRPRLRAEPPVGVAQHHQPLGRLAPQPAANSGQPASAASRCAHHSTSPGRTANVSPVTSAARVPMNRSSAPSGGEQAAPAAGQRQRRVLGLARRALGVAQHDRAQSLARASRTRRPARRTSPAAWRRSSAAPGRPRRRRGGCPGA